MERTLVIILFVVLLVGLGHIYHNSSLKEGAEVLVTSKPQCGGTVPGRDYASIHAKIKTYLDNQVKKGKMNKGQRKAHLAAEHMIHIYDRALNKYITMRDNGRTKTQIYAGLMDAGLINPYHMGHKELKFIESLAQSLDVRVASP